MLQKLYIRNYAIIEELNIEFDEHLNVITGETGAGKSIILGALSLILGERADTSVLINPQEKCIVEATFDVSKNDGFQQMLQAQDLDAEPLCTIRREIGTSGKSRSFVNDTPVVLTLLNSITSLLVDLHRQFDTRALLHSHFRYEIMDAMSDTLQEVKKYQSLYNNYISLQSECRQMIQQQERWNKEADYKQFLYDELADAAFRENEIEETEATLKQLSHAENIKNVLQSALYGLEESEQPINNELKKILQQLQSLTNIFPEVASLTQRTESAWVELRDIADEVSALQHKTELDPEKLQRLQERQDMAYRLLKKHNATTTADLLHIQQQLSAELVEKNTVEEKINKLQQEIQHAHTAIASAADTISLKRKKNAPEFEKKINDLLHLVGMPNAKLKIELADSGTLHSFGKDDIEILIDANNTGKFLPIQKAASGGELSRIMLCIKTLTAKALKLPTLIFDEVDTGISGEAARQVGLLLQKVSEYHQVICITHQPQVAAKGTQHLYVYKSQEKDKSVKTKIKKLNQEEHVNAVAQMIGGNKPSEAAIKNAKELAG